MLRGFRLADWIPIIPASLMRILTIGHSYAIELNRRFCRELAMATGPNRDAERMEVVAVAPTALRGEWGWLPLERSSAEEPYRLEGVPIYGSSAKLPQLFIYGSRLKTLLKERWDIVHCAQEPYVMAGGQVARRTRDDAKLVFSTYQNISKRYPPPFAQIERFAMKRADGWIPMGRTAYEALKDRPGRGELPYEIIPPGVDIEQFRPDPEAKRAIRQRLGWPIGADSGPPVVGFLGRFVPEKGLGLLRSALEAVADTPWRALIVGGGPLEPELRDWERKSQEGQGQGGDRVRIITGVRHAQVPDWLNAMDVLAAPSRTTPRWREQFGRMLIEAMACGVPVVASDSGEIPHVVADAGLILPEADPQAWTRALAELLDDPNKRRELAQRGVERARSLYAWPVVAQAHRDFFAKLLS